MMLTGTPLGDPIEVGALGQALAAGPGLPRCTAVGSVKSVFGHTEGAAGLSGLLLAHGQVAAACRPPVMHLRGMNPYVQAALQEWSKSQAVQAVVQRQSGPAIASKAAGTSSFGMSGINAHAVLAPIQAPGVEEKGVEAAWRRTRCWPRPVAAAVLTSVTSLQSAAHFVCDLHAARLAYLQDYQASLSCKANSASGTGAHSRLIKAWNIVCSDLER